MADDQGVSGTDSPTEGNAGNEDVNAQSSSAAQGVQSGSPADRPDQNWQREFQRKQAEQQKQLEAVLQYLVARDQAAAQPASKGPVTKEELFVLAQQGDQTAFEEYQRRIAREEDEKRASVARKQGIVEGQLRAIVGRYPILNNSSHLLTQKMNQAYQLLQGHGYAPGPETLLEAAKTAIADSPDLVSEIHTQGAQAREQVRQDSTRRAQAGTMGGTYRQEAPRNNQNAPKVSPAEQELAQRMGIKDPAGAMKRFRERQEKGQSSFGSVAAFIPQED